MKHWLAAIALATLAGLAQAEEIIVSAAVSLTRAFKTLAADYESRYPDSKVLLNFGPSGALVQQIAKGAPVDVFASADQESMDLAQQQQLVAATERNDFARNTLVLIKPADSPLVLRQLEDLNQPGVRKVAIGNPATMPVSRYARRALETAGLWPVIEAKAINTQNVRQSLDYVVRGEVDAGFVYATDAAVMQDQVAVMFNVSLDMPIAYPIARTASSVNRDAAQRFIAYVLSPDGQARLAEYGFLPP